MKSYKTLLVAVAAVVACLALAKPQRALLGADGIEHTDSAVPSVSDYIQDGLIAMWDGEFNAIDETGGWYHDPYATVWADLVGDNNLSVLKSWSDCSLVGDGFSRLAEKDQPTPFIEFQTVEVCFRTESEDFQFVYLDCGRRTCIGCYGTSVGVGLRQARLLDYSTLNRNMTISSVYAGTSPTDNTAILACANGIPLVRNGIGNWSSPLAWYSVTVGSAYSPTTSCFQGHVYCIRMYSRALSLPEINHNTEVDKARFGL